MSATTYAPVAAPSVELLAPDVALLADLAALGTDLDTRADGSVPVGVPTISCATWTCV